MIKINPELEGEAENMKFQERINADSFNNRKIYNVWIQ